MKDEHTEGKGKNDQEKIRGGGRFELPVELETTLIDILRNRRDAKNPLKSTTAAVSSDQVKKESAHEAEHKRRQFVKRLVKCHERHGLSMKVNQVCNEKLSSGKVRLELMEAIYSTDKKTSKSWKAGGKKVVVVDRSTNIADLLKQANNKLKPKKTKFVRSFVVDETTEQQMDLIHNCQGLSDGSRVYVTTSNKDDAEEEDATSPVEHSSLQAVKDFYQERQKRQEQRYNRKAANPADVSTSIELPELSPARAALPAAAHRELVLQSLADSRVIVIAGETGCGKSTQIPQYILESNPNNHIVVTQPRKVAAMALAERVATEQESTSPGAPGCTVGYHVRLDRQVDESSTRLVYCTVGILLRQLLSSSTTALLQNGHEVTHLILDEVHERDVTMDFVLTILKQRMEERQNLPKIILMSATQNTTFCKYFASTTKTLLLRIPGRTFPVDTIELEEIEKRIQQQMLLNAKPPKAKPKQDEDDTINVKLSVALSPRVLGPIDYVFVCNLIDYIVKTHKGDLESSRAILVFLPGQGEIARMAQMLQRRSITKDLLEIHSLYSQMATKSYKPIFLPSPNGKFKVILSTNVAESSITIQDVRYVVDTGRVKESRYHSASRIRELVTVWISKASAKQRAGRAGRTCPGTCYRLYDTSSSPTSILLDYTTPEMTRTPLEELILQTLLLGGLDLLRKAPNPPQEGALQSACRHLYDMGALQDELSLTPLGYHLALLPMDVQLGKVLLVGSILGCVESALTIAAALSLDPTRNSIFLPNKDKTIQERQKDLIRDAKGDTMAIVIAFEAWSKSDRKFHFCKLHSLHHETLVNLSLLRFQFRDCLEDAGFYQRGRLEQPQDMILRSCCLVAGLYPHIATLVRPQKSNMKRNKFALSQKGGQFLTSNGDQCIPSSSSFQVNVVKNVGHTGKDVYVVYHTKQRILSADKRTAERIYLTQLNFCSRFAILLFGGQLQSKDNNAIVVDGWLKFKSNRRTTVLLMELRRELDSLLLSRLAAIDKDSLSFDTSILNVVREMLKLDL